MLKSILAFVALIAALFIISTESSADMVVNILDDVVDSEKMVTILSFVVLVATLFIISTSSYAATFTVTNLNDSGAGSLRQAIIDANSNTNGPGVVDEIVFQDGLTGVIPDDSSNDNLFTGEMDITDDVTITGPGADVIIIDAQGFHRIFKIDDDDMNKIVVSISGLTFTNGEVTGTDYGGAIYNAEQLSIDSCTFFMNHAVNNGGAIDNEGTISEITNSTFNRNRADSGGAIFNGDTITSITNSTFGGNSATKCCGGAIFNNFTIEQITNSTFSENTVGPFGGAIYNNDKIKQITYSTFSGNTADEGGAIDNAIDGVIQGITNSTFSGNSAGKSGGAIWNEGKINISFTTIANNEAGQAGGGLSNSTSIYIRNSIVAFNTAVNSGNNCSGSIDDESFNYSDDSSCGFGAGNNASINLGPLQDNGGTTQTIALLSGDPIDGASLGCDPLDMEIPPTPSGVQLPDDQRHFPRALIGIACDAGAYEMGAQGPQGLQGPQGTAGSGGGCALAGANSTNGASALFVFLGYLLIPAVIVVRRRFRRR